VAIVEDLVFRNYGWWAYGQKQLQQSVFIFKLYVQCESTSMLVS